MRQVLPFIVFAFFAALIWWQNRNAEPLAVPPREPGLRGIVMGNPPVNSRADAFARFGFYLAWAIGAVAIVGDVIPLILPSGVLIAATGVILTLNTSGARDQLVERARRGVGHRRFGSAVLIGPMFGVLMTIIGVLWVVGGVAALLR